MLFINSPIVAALAFAAGCGWSCGGERDIKAGAFGAVCGSSLGALVVFPIQMTV